jgi:transposase-like protein
MGQKWTEREEAMLMQMVSDKEDYNTIAGTLDRTLGSVVSKAKDMRRRAGMPPKQRKERSDAWSDAEVETLIDMFEDGYRVSDIAKKLGRGLAGTRFKLVKLRNEGQRVNRRRTVRANADMLRKARGIKLGNISNALFSDGDGNVSRDAVDWIVNYTIKHGYPTVAEALVDIALEQYFQEIGDGK